MVLRCFQFTSHKEKIFGMLQKVILVVSYWPRQVLETKWEYILIHIVYTTWRSSWSIFFFFLKNVILILFSTMSETLVHTVLFCFRFIFMDNEMKILFIMYKTGIIISVISLLTHCTKWTRPYVFRTLQCSLALGIVKL